MSRGDLSGAAGLSRDFLHVLGALLVLCFCGQAAGEQPARLDLADAIFVLADPDGELEIDDVSRPEMRGQFLPSTQKVFQAGFTSVPHWFRVLLPPAHRLPDQEAQWQLWLAQPLLDVVDFYLPDGSGGWKLNHTGDQRPFSQRLVPHRDFVQPVQLHPQQPTEVYLRVQTQGSLELPLSLVADHYLWRESHDTLMLRGAFYGLMLGMLVYNLLIYITIRDRLYFQYLMVILFGGILAPLSLDGMGVQYIWGEYPFLSNISTPVSMAGTIFWASRYTRGFFEHRDRAPILDALLHGFMYVAGFSMLLPFLLPYSVTILLAIGIPTIGTLLIGLLNLRLMLFGDRDGVVYFLAFMPIMICGIVKTLHSIGLLPSNLFTVNALQLGMGGVVVGLSLVLAEKYNRERGERVRVSRLKRFFSPEVASAIIMDGGEELLRPTRRHVVVVFADMRGFTAFSDRTEPDEVLNVLREYHKITTEKVRQYQGTLEHFVGDGVMICFNTPVMIEQPEKRALEMVLELNRQYALLQAEWQGRGHALGIGIGMASGEATVGVVGEAERQDYTTIGSVVNLASRLCDLARGGEILVAGSLYETLSGSVDFEDIGQQHVKGILEPVRIYKVLPPGTAHADT